MKSALINLAKLGVAGTSIAAIAAIMLTVSPKKPTEGVAGAHADIFDLASRQTMSETIFSRMMQDVGMNPRPFDYNGNVVNFGAMEVLDEPEKAMGEFQRKFVEEGINRKAHTKTMLEYGIGQPLADDQLHDYQAAVNSQPNNFTLTPEQIASSELAADFLNGEIMPVARHEDFVSMSGIIPKKKYARDLKIEEFPTKWITTEKGYIDPRDNIDGFRYMDFSKTVDNKSTSVTAVWSDKDFNGHKLDPDYDGTDVSSDRDVPPCVGCSRMFRIDGLSDQDPFTTNQFHTFSDTESVSTFYKQSFARRGWKQAEHQVYMERLFEEIPSLQRLEGEMLFLERDGERLEVMLHNMGEGGTAITTMQEREAIEVPSFKAQ